MDYHKAAQEEPSIGQTIAAIATAPGQSAIAVVRVSGAGSALVAETLAGKCPNPRYAALVSFRDRQKRVIDRGLMLYFPGPASYTGEDMLELHCHGGMAVLDQLMHEITFLGVRVARPGEFSERAFVNGKINLIQAEAIAALIESSSIPAARVVARAVVGDWVNRLQDIDKGVLSLRAQLEAQLDFPEEDIATSNIQEVLATLRGLLQSMQSICHHCSFGQQMQRGMQVVMAGKPNSGKSTLFNALIGTARAIVTDQPGTTRDPLLENMAISGVHITLVDTAGLRQSTDTIEREGVNRAQQAIAGADLVLLLSEGDTPNELLQQVKSLAPQVECLQVRTKTDLCGTPVKSSSQLGVCALNGQGLENLCARIVNHAGGQEAEQSALYCSMRVASQLAKATGMLADGIRQWQHHASPELLLTDLSSIQAVLS
ncbi:MAG: tRNA uridine-5-carboxymethylaminomethyl(34) synthesis GTPase MnmE, partial [Candidatus Porifericomitaceae bacterium WSBS_2022_MAG_OTU9]